MNAINQRKNKLDIEIEWIMLGRVPVIVYYHLVRDSAPPKRYLDHYTLLDSLNDEEYSKINIFFNGPGEYDIARDIFNSGIRLRNKIDIKEKSKVI